MSSSETGTRAKALQALVRFTVPVYRALTRRPSEAWTVDRATLLAGAEGTLGRALGEFLTRYDLELMPALESHDVFHVLLGYQQTVLDEARMQCCLVGSGRRSLYSLGTVLLAIASYPTHTVDLVRHVLRGRSLANFSRWDFEVLLGAEVEELRARIGITS